MKKLIMMLALCIGVQAVSLAQPQDRKGSHRSMTPEQRAEKQTAHMQQALQLTDAQKKAVYELNLQSAKEMQAKRKDHKAAGKEQFKEMHQQKEERLKSILSADQFAKYQSMKAERMNKMKQKRDRSKDVQND